MIRFDLWTKVVLTIIAGALVALLWNSGKDVGVASAQAAATKTATRVEVALIKDIPVTDFKEVILLGDQKTFLIRVDKGIGVYQVQEFAQ